MSEEHRISFEFTGRYRVLGTPGESIKHLWIVCHGHGHLAEYFVKQFSCLDDGSHLIVAPEGLSKYYLKGFSGRVGATWMTKEDRLNDIDNYLQYLKAVYGEVRKQLKEEVKVTLFGFSQGAATISRFAAHTDVWFDRLVLWAGIFPPDLPPIQSVSRLEGKPVYWVYGTKDPFLNQGIMDEQGKIADQIKVTPEVFSFEGEHELYDELLISMSQKPYRHQ